MKIFENISALKAAKLTAGQIVETKGYTTLGDGRCSKYYIQTPAQYSGVPDENTDHTLANGNIAVKVEGLTSGQVSLSDMKAIPTSGLVEGETVLLTDAGRTGIFKWRATDSSTQVSADTREGVFIAPNEDTTGASGCWERVMQQLELNVRWFGALGDGVTDDLPALQSAEALLGAYAGGIIFLPRGVYHLSGVWNITNNNINVIGEGKDVTTIKDNQTTGNVVEFNPSSNSEKCSIRDLSITTDATGKVGAGLLIDSVDVFKAENIFIYGSINTGIQAKSSSFGGNDYHFNRVYISVNSDGFDFGQSTSNIYNVFIDQCKVVGADEAGLIMGDINGEARAYKFAVSNCIFEACNIGVFIKNAADCRFTNVMVRDSTSHSYNLTSYSGLSYIGSNSFTNCSAVSSGEDSFYLYKANGTFQDNMFTNCESFEAGNRGWHLINVSFTNLVGCTITGSNDDGVFVSCNNVMINGCLIKNNGAGTGGKHGIEVLPGKAKFMVTGCTITGNDGYGVMINDGTSYRYLITGCLLNENTLGAVSDGGTGGISIVNNYVN